MRQVSTTMQYYYWGGISRFYLELLMTMSHLLDIETKESKWSPALPPRRQWIIHGEGGQGEGLPRAFSVNDPLAPWREGRGQQGYRNGRKQSDANFSNALGSVSKGNSTAGHSPFS